MAKYWLYPYLMEHFWYDKKIGDFLSDIALPVFQAPKILDIGCGTWASWLALARRFPDAHITFTDLREEFVRDAMSKLRATGHTQVSGGILDINSPRILQVIWETQERVEKILAAWEYDIIVMGGVLCYANDIIDTLTALEPALKKWGKLINLEMHDGVISRMVCDWYDYLRADIEEIAGNTEAYVGPTEVQEIWWQYFPINLTRTAIITTKE